MTTKRVHQEYLKTSTAQVAAFAEALKDNATSKEGTFDSAAASDFLATAINQNTGVEVPKTLQAVMDDTSSGEKDEAERSRIARAILDGIVIYESQHGVSAPAVLI